MFIDKGLCDLWDSAPDSAIDNKKRVVPNGKYVGKVLSVVPKTTEAGKNFISWDIVISEGEYKNWHVFYAMFLTEKSIPYVKTTFEKMGFSGIPLEELDTVVFPQLLDGTVEFQTKASESVAGKDPFINVFINKFIPVGDELPF